MENREVTLIADEGGKSQKLASVSTSQQSAAIQGEYVVIHATQPVFVRQGANPTAVADGTDQYIPSGVGYRLAVTRGNKLAFVAVSTAADVYITPRG